jgi:hypothetical protein
MTIILLLVQGDNNTFQIGENRYGIHCPGLSATSQQYFSPRTNQPPATRQQYSPNKSAPTTSDQPNEHDHASLCSFIMRDIRNFDEYMSHSSNCGVWLRCCALYYCCHAILFGLLLSHSIAIVVFEGIRGGYASAKQNFPRKTGIAAVRDHGITTRRADAAESSRCRRMRRG